MGRQPGEAQTPPQRRRPGRPKGGQVLANREQLLAAAVRAINRVGPDVTMEDIAAEATVSKPILYRTVGDRDTLVEALSELMVDRINAAVLVAANGQTNPRDAFCSSVRGYFDAVDADRNLFLYVNAGGTGADRLGRLVERSAAQMVGRFADIRQGAGLDPAGANTWSYAIVGAFQVVALMWVRDAYSDIDTVAEDLTQLLWPGVSGS